MTSLDRLGRSQLHYAAADGDVTHAQELVAAGQDVSLADSHGWTPLHFAAQASSAAIAALLITAGAPVDAQDAHGNTPLFRAIFSYQGDPSVIELLRAHGADPSLQNSAGQTPLGLANLIANTGVRECFRDLEAAT